MASAAPSSRDDQSPSAGVDAVAFRIDGATQADPSGILASVIQNGDDITVTTGAAGISNYPEGAASWERPIANVFGAPATFDLGDVFRAIGRASALPAPADLHFGMSIESADGQRGAAWRMAAVGGQWQVQHTAKATGAWANGPPRLCPRTGGIAHPGRARAGPRRERATAKRVPDPLDVARTAR